MIPATNQLHLVLHRDVIDAVAAGQFHLYTVRTVDEALELLTGLVVGERNHKGQYPKKSLNALVLQKLTSMAGLVNGSSDDES